MTIKSIEALGEECQKGLTVPFGDWEKGFNMGNISGVNKMMEAIRLRSIQQVRECKEEFCTMKNGEEIGAPCGTKIRLLKDEDDEVVRCPACQRTMTNHEPPITEKEVANV